MFTEFIVLPVHVSHNLVAFITDALVHYWVINVSIWLLLEYGYFKVKGRLIFFSFSFFPGPCAVLSASVYFFITSDICLLTISILYPASGQLYALTCLAFPED